MSSGFVYAKSDRQALTHPPSVRGKIIFQDAQRLLSSQRGLEFRPLIFSGFRKASPSTAFLPEGMLP
jgi:hypothetical protein